MRIIEMSDIANHFVAFCWWVRSERRRKQRLASFLQMANIANNLVFLWKMCWSYRGKSIDVVKWRHGRGVRRKIKYSSAEWQCGHCKKHYPKREKSRRTYMVVGNLFYKYTVIHTYSFTLSLLWIKAFFVVLNAVGYIYVGTHDIAASPFWWLCTFRTCFFYSLRPAVIPTLF